MLITEERNELTSADGELGRMANALVSIVRMDSVVRTTFSKGEKIDSLFKTRSFGEDRPWIVDTWEGISLRLLVYSAWLIIRCCSFALVIAGSSVTTVNLPLLLLKSSWYLAWEKIQWKYDVRRETWAYVALNVGEQTNTLHLGIVGNHSGFRLRIMSRETEREDRSCSLGWTWRWKTYTWQYGILS